MNASVGRGDVVVVVASDPFRADEDAVRPFLVVGREATPFHGEQYIALALTTRTWHDERIPLADDDWVEGGAPASSSVMPWSVNAVAAEWIDYRQGQLREGVVDRSVERLRGYVE